MPRRTILLLGLLLTCALAPMAAQPAPAATSELRDTVDRYTADRAVLLRRYDVPFSPARQERMRAFYDEWRGRLRAMDFNRLGLEGRVDYVLLDHEVAYQVKCSAARSASSPRRSRGFRSRAWSWTWPKRGAAWRCRMDGAWRKRSPR
jgi:hypothetical protein